MFSTQYCVSDTLVLKLGLHSFVLTTTFIWSVPNLGSPLGLQGSSRYASLWAPMAGFPRGRTAESWGVLVHSLAGQRQLVLQSLYGFIPATSESSGFSTFSSVLYNLCQSDWVWNGISSAYL